jgi:hypothetical protein
MANVLSRCQRPGPISCTCTNLKAHYQHIAPGVNHQWDVQPSVGPDADSAPHPAPCPNDGGEGGGPAALKYPAVYSKCPVCGYIKVWAI